MIFTKSPSISVEPEELQCVCPCKCDLLIQKTKERKITTLHLGTFLLYEVRKYCPACNAIYRQTKIDNFVAPGSNFGYDIMEYIGRAVWSDLKTVEKIRNELAQKNVSISEREIAHLAKKFVTCVIEAFDDQKEEIRTFLHKDGGYFLHFDSTHPNQGSSHLMCAIAEEVSEKVSMVLGSAKLATESIETVTAFLRGIKEKFGDPLAGISDMLASNLTAFREVFPAVLLLLCHFHYLRDLGKDLFSYENTRLNSFLETYDTHKRLKGFIKDCKAKIEADPLLVKYLNWTENEYQPSLTLPDIVTAYFMGVWILNYKQDLHGYGFPFDRAHFSYLQRMKKVWGHLLTHQVKSTPLKELESFLGCLFGDPSFAKVMASMEQKVQDFDHIRDIMRIAPKMGDKGLNDDGEECDMILMEEELKKFLDSPTIKDNKDPSYRKIEKQMKKYWKMLFAKPIEVKTANGEIVSMYPQRTNNVMERLFREFLRNECKRTGSNTLHRRVQAMVAETPMMRNLNCPEFMKIILKGEKTLGDRFAALTAKRIQRNMSERDSAEDRLPRGLQKLIESPRFYKTFYQKAA
jgi:hypothetical protein